MELTGKLQSKEIQEFRDHQVLATYITQKGNDVDSRESGEISSKVSLDGSFSVVVPDELVDVVFEVISPDGEILKSIKYSKQDIPRDKHLVIECEPKKYS